jgi:RND family efflux transporter MFP subunit
MMKKVLWSVLLLIASLQAEGIYTTFTVEAKQHADLAFTSSGTVQRVNIDVASVVKKDEVLAALNSDDLQAALQIAKVALVYAKRDLERQQRVKKLVDEARFDQYRFKYENAKAQVAYQQSLLDKTLLKAPFDGVIYEKTVEVGDVVSGAMIRTVMKIQSLKARKLILNIDQKYWKQIEPGLTFRYKVDGDDTEHTGEITKVYPYANSANRKIRAEVEAQDFTPGLFGEGHIIIPDSK